MTHGIAKLTVMDADPQFCADACPAAVMATLGTGADGSGFRVIASDGTSR